MSLGSRAGMELVFGADNIAKWADVDNNDDQDVISARITWALGLADTDINTELRNSRYDTPLTEPTDSKVVWIADVFAGVHLYESRGITDADENESHQLKPMHDKAMKALMRIVAGAIDITVKPVKADYPQVIVDD